MGFFRRKRLANVAAPIAPPMPLETTVNHYYSSSRLGTIFALFLVVVCAAVLGWYAAVFLAGQVGAARPERAVAYCIMGLSGLLTFLGGLGVFAKFVLRDFMSHRERMAEKYIQLEQARTRAVQLIPPTTQARMTRDESRKYQAVKVVMDRAYQIVDDKGKLSGSKKEPWSRREVGALTLLNEREPIGENSRLASWIKSYLLDRNILASDRQVNVVDFPNLAAVEAQLVKDFGPPILFSAGDAGMSTHYITRGNGRESWG